MPKKLISTILLFSTLAFITIGDLVLPQPLKGYSRSTRNTLNQVILGLFPDKKPERPSKQREGEVDEFYRRAEPSSRKNSNDDDFIW